MVIYHAINTYQMMVSLAHGLLEHGNEKRILILPQFIVKKYPQYAELEKREIVDEVKLFNYSKYNQKSREYILEHIENDFENLLSNINLEDVNEIYVGAIQYYFSLYLCMKKKRFNIIEDGAGLYSKHALLVKTIQKQEILNCELLSKYGILDMSCEYIDKKLCLYRAQDEGFDKTGTVNFDIVESLYNVDHNYLNEILLFFRTPQRLLAKDNSIIILTQNFANLKQLSFEEQILIYQIVFDFLFEGKYIYIKPHPDDVLYYEKLFPKAEIIKEKFPSELIPYIFEKKPDAVATISSTGLSLIKSLFERSTYLGVEYESYFKETEKVYVALLVANMYPIVQIEYRGKNRRLFQVLKESLGVLPVEKSGEKILIVEDAQIDEEELKKYSLVIFLNADDKYLLTDVIAISSLFPLCIKKKVVREEECYYPLDDTAIYVYGKEFEKLKKFEFKKELHNCGVEIEIERMDERDIYIKVLEGQVRALEKRLEHLINENGGTSYENSWNNTI